MEMFMKFGFVYIWYDKGKHKYYIGSHWGHYNDGYVCSSTWMRDARRKRPNDFKRRILETIPTNREDLLIAEQKWLDKIRPEKFRNRYYNITDRVYKNYWWLDEDRKLSTRQKISKKLKGRINKPNKGTTGKKYSEETKLKMSIAQNERYKQIPVSDKSKEKNRLSHLGRKHSEETKEKIRKNNAWTGKKRPPRTEEHKKKLSAARKATCQIFPTRP
jgi:hypothetical protein